MQALLALADGSLYAGRSIGAPGVRCAELVFNTAMSGYQEVLTDPSYRGQVVVMTAPMIGTYGMMPGAEEAAAPIAEGIVVREACEAPFHPESRETLSRYLARHGVAGIDGVDTRALARRIREHGLVHACIGTGKVDPTDLVARAQAFRGLDGVDTVAAVTTPVRYTFAPSRAGAPKVAVLDCGVKRGMLAGLATLGCGVEVFPAATSPGDLLDARPDGVLLSNGPGDPAGLPHIIDTVRSLVGHVPLFGICLGHQLLALALGGRTYKLPFGHHGCNHPVRDLRTGRVAITSQNHNHAVDAASLGGDVAITHVSLYDGTVEAMRHRSLPVWSVQFHPEAAPGPNDATHLFAEFVAELQKWRPGLLPLIGDLIQVAV